MLGWLRGRRSRPDIAAPGVLDGAVIGDLEGPTAIVDRHGRIGALDGSWSLEWGAKADDRWRIPHDEVAVRQNRIDDAPVYETWMRVPGGDVVARVAAVSDGLGRALSIEFENASPTAVAVALVGVVPEGGRVEASQETVNLDGAAWIVPARASGGLVAMTGDPWPAIESGPANDPVSAASNAAVSAGVVLALPHRQRVSFTVSVDGAMPTRSPMPADVASGWHVVTADALTIDLPDAALGEAWRRILCDLVVQAGSTDTRWAAEAAWYLDVAGLHSEADRARATVVVAVEASKLSGADAASSLLALASRDLRAGQESGLDELAGFLATDAGDALDAATLELVARALDSAAPEAAVDARRLMARAPADVEWEAESPAAAAAERVLAVVVDDWEPGVVDLLPQVPDEWRGQPVDVRGLCTLAGRISFSVRWHGDRPALLWEREGGDEQIEIRCPGLDAEWSTTERQGEALLAASAD